MMRLSSSVNCDYSIELGGIRTTGCIGYIGWEIDYSIELGGIRTTHQFSYISNKLIIALN